tara:strand:- start:359 stop:1168 length:810 start_codon:yes stop_codon:yes gene_type:complete
MTRLVSYGCSHTSGAELADHIMLGTDIETVDKLKSKYISGGDTLPQAWKKIWNEYGFSFDPYSKFDDIFRSVSLKEIPHLESGEDICRSLTWVRYLTELRGHTHYINRGFGGGSLELCVYLLEGDIIDGIIDTKKDEVIVQVPHPYRWMELDFDGMHKTITPYEQGNYWNMTWSYYQLLRHIKLLGVKYFFIEKPTWRLRNEIREDNFDSWSNPINNNKELFAKYWNWIGENAIPTNDEFYSNPKHAGEHYYTETHKLMAENLNDKLGN